MGSGFHTVGTDMAGGEGGGDGVVEVERNVGPRGVEDAEGSGAGEPRKSGNVRSGG